MHRTPKNHFIAGMRHPLAQDAQMTPPVPCEFAVGDRVTFTNDYGVQFFNRVVTGFSPSVEGGRFIYFDNDAWWFPVSPANLAKQSREVALHREPASALATKYGFPAPNDYLLNEYESYAKNVAEGDPMEFDDWLAGSDLPEIVQARNYMKSAFQLSIERSKVEHANAAQKGLVILPSVDGPYIFDPVADRVVGRQDSEEYRMAISDQPLSMTKERFLELQSKAESLDMDHAQGRVLPFHYERVQQISALMDASPWTLHPDHGCILSSDVANLDRQAMCQRG